MDEVFSHARSARSPRSLALIAVALAALAGLVFVVDAAPWISAVFALLVLPAIWDAVRGSEARLTLDATHLAWQSGRRSQRLPLGMIDEAVLSTSLDFTQRAKLALTTGETLRIPPECLPPGRRLDAEFERRGIRFRRSLFGF